MSDLVQAYRTHRKAYRAAKIGSPGEAAAMKAMWEAGGKMTAYEWGLVAAEDEEEVRRKKAQALASGEMFAG